VCTTDAKGEQHCSVQTAWWGSASTNATRANNTATTPRPRLRGLAATRVEERGEAGGVRVEAGGPVTDSATGMCMRMCVDVDVWLSGAEEWMDGC
jgi:hypothetical protein